MNNVKKLCLYCLDCIKSTAKSSDFINLKSNKENKIIITDLTEFESDNKAIIEMMTMQALNRSTMGLYAGRLIIEGQKGKNKYYSPLLYTEAELIRDNDVIKFQYDVSNMVINISLISSLLDNDSDIIEHVISQLLDIDNPCNIDFVKVLNGLIDMDGLTIKEENALILAKMPESIAGLINELRAISDFYQEL